MLIVMIGDMNRYTWWY